jgi:hypothetical protein
MSCIAFVTFAVLLTERMRARISLVLGNWFYRLLYLRLSATLSPSKGLFRA